MRTRQEIITDHDKKRELIDQYIERNGCLTVELLIDIRELLVGISKISQLERERNLDQK